MSSAVSVACGASDADMNVFSATQHQLGRRLHLPTANSDAPLQPTTGGLVIFAGQKAYQITAWNPSFRRDTLSPESTLEGGVADAEAEMEEVATMEWDLEGSELGSDFGSEGASETSYDATESRYPSSIDIAAMSSAISDKRHVSYAATSSALQEHLSHQDLKGKSLEIPRGCVSIGKLASVSWTDKCDSHLLVELTGADVNNAQDVNTTSYDSHGGGLRVRATKPGKITNVKSSLPAIAAVAEHSVGCRLFTSPVLHTLKGRRKCRHVFQIYFDSHLFQNEDCGAAVLDLRSGEVFGQVVCGSPGTPLAYILPIEDIIQDVAAQLIGTEIAFSPPVETSRVKHPILRSIQYASRKAPKHQGNAYTEPHKFFEFGSPQYFQDLSGHRMPPRQHLRSLGETIRGSFTIKPTWPKFTRRHGKTRPPKIDTAKASFFSLPAEICDMIIDQLSFRCAMNFRKVSRACRAAVSINGPAISKRLLEKCPLPPLARRLYPISLLDLSYVWDVGYRHAVASKLAGHMASWLERDVYLHRSKCQQQVFQGQRTLLQKRLLPALFTAFHFFEMYPRSLKASLHKSRGTKPEGFMVLRKPISYAHERKVMDRYSNDVLMQTHDVMKCLINYIQAMVAPPSYYGPTERLLRGYYQTGPNDTVLVTILCLGGLGKILQLADIKDYSKRRAEVDKMYSALIKSGNDSTSMLIPNGLNGESTANNDIPNPQQHLPILEHIWCRTAENLVVRRGIVQKPQDLRTYPQVLTELARPASAMTVADQLYREHQLWHGLSNHNFDTIDG